MIKILFVCHGNICRSPMAEYYFMYLADIQHIGDRFHVESAATSREEIGNGVHRGTVRVLNRFGIDCSSKRARQIKQSDYSEFDYIIGMDEYNMQNMLRVFGGDSDHKLHLMMSFAGGTECSVADPWYTGDFEQTFRDIDAGCRGLIAATCK